MVYSELKIVSSDTLEKRSYITFYFNGKRIREFNGNNLDQDIKPNFAKTIKERDYLLKKLEYELRKALESNLYPKAKKTYDIALEPIQKKSLQVLLKEALDKKLNANLNRFYKRNLTSIYNSFIDFLSPKEKDGDIANIKRARIEEFLSQFNSSGTYYMNKRRDLGVLFASVSKTLELKLSVVKDTDTRKSKASLHKIYETEQIKPILDFLKANHPNLYLCCLICYGCFLRPHEEVRNLYGYHFKKDLTEIHLAGHENKGGRVRVVYIPDYVRKELEPILPYLKPNLNIFTLKEHAFNDAYFNTAWTRAWQKMFKLGIVEKNQTIYSFRHTAAVNVYKKTKDLNILQQLLGHSDMIVTLKYLRGLGEATSAELKNVMPELSYNN